MLNFVYVNMFKFTFPQYDNYTVTRPGSCYYSTKKEGQNNYENELLTLQTIHKDDAIVEPEVECLRDHILWSPDSFLK
jgi:hypothetical protein